MFSILMGVALKSTAVLAAAWLITLFLRKRSAAARHLVWTAAAVAVLTLPILTVSLPALRLPISNATTSIVFQAIGSSQPSTQIQSVATPLGKSSPCAEHHGVQIGKSLSYRFGLGDHSWHWRRCYLPARPSGAFAAVQSLLPIANFRARLRSSSGYSIRWMYSKVERVACR